MAGDAHSELQKLYALATARVLRFGARWKIHDAEVHQLLERSVASWGGLARGESAEDYLEALRAEDLALAIACRAGIAPAWECFIEKYRPILYASARAICRDEMMARELADSMWAELYGVDARGGQHRSLLDYFHGRSSLATWLRAIVALGRIAHDSTVAALAIRRSAAPFGHGACHAVARAKLFDSYHCSRYNTNTGVLTETMFHDVFAAVRDFLDAD